MIREKKKNYLYTQIISFRQVKQHNSLVLLARMSSSSGSESRQTHASSAVNSSAKEDLISKYEKELQQFTVDFEKQNKRVPKLDDILKNSSWNHIYESKRLLEFEIAKEQYKEGYCSVYIPRRRRFCLLRAADNCNGKCTEHYELEFKNQPKKDNDLNNSANKRSKVDVSERATSSFIDSNNDDGNVEDDKNNKDDSYNESIGMVNEKWKLKSNISRRMKKMTNPLAKQFQKPLKIPHWSAIFQNPQLPCLIDIGCAKGRFLQKMAISDRFIEKFGSHNFIGIEIFEPLAIAANIRTRELGLKNLHYINGSANTTNFLDFLRSVGSSVSKICIQFPDPWFDEKACRRVLTTDLLGQIAAGLCEDGQLYIVSDVHSLALDMREIALRSGLFRFHPIHLEHGSELGWGQTALLLTDSIDTITDNPKCDQVTAVSLLSDIERQHQWLRVRPYFEATERDQVCELKRDAAVYRMLFVKV